MVYIRYVGPCPKSIDTIDVHSLQENSLYTEHDRMQYCIDYCEFVESNGV
jgi:hypothetical protein